MCARKPAAVLLDVIIPDPDGYMVCRQLRATSGLERLAIIILTASTDPKLHILAFKADAPPGERSSQRVLNLEAHSLTFKDAYRTTPQCRGKETQVS